MRLFPRFTRQELDIIDPAAFAKTPVVRRFFPNYLHLEYAPFTDIDVVQEVWVPTSQSLCGRFAFTNQGAEPASFRFDWVAQLNPTDGERMGPLALQSVSVLAGQSAALRPVVFMTSGATPRSSPYPALSQELELAPGAAISFIWCQAALTDVEASFNLARQLAARPVRRRYRPPRAAQFRAG